MNSGGAAWATMGGDEGGMRNTRTDWRMKAQRRALLRECHERLLLLMTLKIVGLPKARANAARRERTWRGVEEGRGLEQEFAEQVGCER